MERALNSRIFRVLFVYTNKVETSKSGFNALFPSPRRHNRQELGKKRQRKNANKPLVCGTPQTFTFVRVRTSPND